MAPSCNGPLDGVRIVDLTTVIMGPYATHLLADMGADVIKVEGPEGDPYRNYTPQRNVGMSGSVLNLHRNKRSVVLDLKDPGCRDVLDQIVATADVLVHNLRPKVIERLGYSYERVSKLKPDIVYCGAYGFGTAGDYRDKPAYDDMIQAGSGIAGLYDEIHGKPEYVPSVIYDKLSGQTIAYAILAGLVKRGRTGRGMSIEAPMFETAVEFNLVEHLSGSAFVPPLGAFGAARVLTKRRKPYQTKDGHVCILPYSDKNWQDFFDFVKRHDCKTDPRFETLAKRVVHVEAIYTILEEEAVKYTNAEWVAFGDRANVPCMAVVRLEDLPSDPHLVSAGMFTTVEHPSEGAYLSIRPAVTFSDAEFFIRHHAPRLGQHTEEVLNEVGVAAEKIAEVMSRGR
jgi:crotonobetainyl-CoA:carnitine CoA-transferase CaiB-like acyl-CoA transferase